MNFTSRFPDKEVRQRITIAESANSPIRDLIELKGELADEARALIERAQDFGRGLSSGERAEFDRLKAHIKDVTDRIEARERQIEIDNREAERFDRQQRGVAGPNGYITADGRLVDVFTPEQRMAPDILPAEYRDMSFGSFVRAMVLGARTEAERRALAEGSDATGGATVPSPLSAQLIDALRARTQTIKAGAKTVKMDSDTLSFARLEDDPSGSWHAENQPDIAESSPNFARLKLTAFTLTALVKISRELLEDSLNIEKALTAAFAKALAIEVDKVALIGTGSGQPKGIANYANVGIVDMGTDGAALADYDPVLDAINTMLTANAGDPSAAIMHPRTLTAFNKLKDSQNRSLARPPSIANLPFLPTTIIPIDDTHGTATDASRVFVGDYSGLMIGIRSQVRIDTLRERYAENYQYGFLASMRCDVALEHDEQFAIIEGIIPPA